MDWADFTDFKGVFSFLMLLVVLELSAAPQNFCCPLKFWEPVDLQKSICQLWPIGEGIEKSLENRPTLFFNFRGGLFSSIFSISSPFGHKWHIDFCKSTGSQNFRGQQKFWGAADNTRTTRSIKKLKTPLKSVKSAQSTVKFDKNPS